MTVNSGGAGNNDFELAQGPRGRLTALWTDGSPYRLNYTTAVDGGALWSSHAVVALHAGYPTDLKMATGPNSSGIAVRSPCVRGAVASPPASRSPAAPAARP